jgi:hypothetical protein
MKFNLKVKIHSFVVRDRVKVQIHVVYKLSVVPHSKFIELTPPLAGLLVIRIR